MYEAMGSGSNAVCRSDAQGIAEAKTELVDVMYSTGKSPSEAANVLLA